MSNFLDDKNDVDSLSETGSREKSSTAKTN